MQKKRAAFRLEVAEYENIFLLLDRGLVKHRVVDLSEGGVRFYGGETLKAGSSHTALINFPWLDELLAVKIKVVRAITTAKRDTTVAGDHRWEIAASFVQIPLAMEDKLFRQVRLLDWRAKGAGFKG